MTDTPFFRGPNQMDWLFAVSLQSAVDWQGPAAIKEVADSLGFENLTQFQFGDNPKEAFTPGVSLVYTTDFLFVVCQSTRTNLQWFGNLFGSQATTVENIVGSVAQYFGEVANTQWSAIANDVAEAAPSKKLVFVGFSLGGAAAALLKEIAELFLGGTSACVVFGCPRVGLQDYVDGYPASNFFRLQCVNDPVASVPPIPWTGIGAYVVWTPFPPFVTYVSQGPSFLLTFPGNVGPGDFTQPLSDIILAFDSGLYEQFHNQRSYAGILRFNLPQVLEDGFEGYRFASKLDPANRVNFSWSPLGWEFGIIPSEVKPEVLSMSCQGVLYIRNGNGVPLGFQEPFYFTSGDPASLTGVMDGIATQRQKFLSKSCQIYAHRVSVVGGPRQSYLKKFVNPLIGQIGTDDDAIDPAVVYFGYTTGRLHKRQFHFRGIASSWLDTDALTGAGLAQLATIEGYLQFLITNGVGLLNKKGLGPYVLASAAQSAQNQLITITVDTTFPGVPANTPIIITGCKAAPLLNGTWLSVGTPTAPTQITLSGSQRISAPLLVQGKVFIGTPSVLGMTEFGFNGVAPHKTGRPSFLRRGRRSAQVRRR